MLSNQTVDETLSFTKLRVKAFSCNQLQNKASFFSFLYELFQSYFTFDDDDIYIYIYIAYWFSLLSCSGKEITL
jgi:hypothetical protein